MKRIPRTLHAPALKRTENNEKVATYSQTFEDAPRASVTTRGKQREGRHLRPEFRGRSTRQCSNAPKTTRGSPLTPRISRTLHAPALQRTKNNERVATCSQNFKDSPRASDTTRRKQREGRHLRPEFRGRSTRQRHDARKTPRGSPLAPRISRTLHAPASRRAENNERVAIYAQNFEDAPPAGVTTRRKLREGRHLRPEFRGRSTRQRHDTPETARGAPLTPRISRTLCTPASQCAENNERVTTYVQNFGDAPRASVTTRGNSERVATYALNFEDAPRASVTTRRKQ